MHIVLTIREQQQEKEMTSSLKQEEHKNLLTKEIYQRSFFFKRDMLCYKLEKREEHYEALSNYFVGIDWLEEEKVALFVEPKMNDSESEIDFMRMVIESFGYTENLEQIDGLFHIEYDKPWINIQQKQDILSPILIVQFLQLLKRIVQKGLKKSYYKVTENLESRVKGKVLVAQQIKQNLVKNKLTKTVCNYQQFGIDTTENQFLKLVLSFVTSYIHQNKAFGKKQKTGLQNIISYCQPAFENIATIKKNNQKTSCSKNPFYKEYEQAIKIGEYILKRFSYNISKTAETITTTPPFWIDMSKLFELYVFGKLKEVFKEPQAVTYHDKYLGGKETDILIKAEDYKCVVECKYKPRYENGTIDLGDKRQLAGYVRMKSVYKKLGVGYEKVIPGVFIYSHQSCNANFSKESIFNTLIEEYIQFYKLGIQLPTVD